MWRFQSLAAVGLLLALLLLQGTFGNKAAGLRKLFLDTDPLEEMSENVMPLFEQNEGVLFSAASEASSQMPVPTAALPSASLASSQMLVVTPALSSAVAVASGASSSTVNPKTALPSECYNYAVLNQFNRAITYRGARHFCDRRLSGWYRFVGKAGSKMPHSCVTGRRCGADGPGWIVGRHPSVSEGVARRRVCFAGSRGWFYRSSCCRWSTYISVRNCGTFFVYKLRRPPTYNLRYCGDGIHPKPRPSIASSQVLVPTPALSSASLASSQMLVVTPALSSECYNYAVLDQSNRAITYRGASHFCDRRLSGWYRFVGKAGSKMPHSCVTGRRCGADGPGWLVGRHPSVSEGVARRRVCFAGSRGWFYRSSCCRWSTYISVRNCGTFFVYKLRRPPTCNLRYCGDGIHLKPRPFIASSQVLIPTSALSSASLASSQMVVVTPALSSASLASSQMLVITPASSSASLPSSQGLVSTLALSSSRASLASSQMLGVVTPALSSASIVSSQMLVPTPALPLTLASSSAVLLHTSSLSADTSKGVFLSCLRNTMMVRIPRDRLPSHLDSIQLHLNDPRCGALHVDKKNVLLRTSLTGCGTVRRFIDGKNSFHNNVVISSGNKRSIVRVPFRCSYSRYGLPGVGSRGK